MNSSLFDTCFLRPNLRRARCTISLAAVALLGGSSVFANTNGLGASPLMGWSSWSTMGKSVSESKIEAQADALVAQLPGLPAGTTLKSLGYTYVNIDSGWRDSSSQVDGNGYERYDRTKFPNGIIAVANYVHSKGLKLGIYLTPGMLKAAYDGNFPIVGTTHHTQEIANPSINGNTENSSGASYSYHIDFTKAGAVEYIQGYANLVASWGVDYIKFDFVGPGGGNIPADSREEMRHWLTATENLPAGSAPIWIELSNSLKFANASDWKAIANGWRIDGDIESGGGVSWSNVSKRFNDSPQWAPFEGPGGWGDMDTVQVGDGGEGLTVDERRTHMTLWSIACSPLILGRNLTKLSSTDIPIISNPEVIAVNQAGRVALPVSQATSQQVWRVKNADGSYTVALFNLGSSTATVTAHWSDLGFSGSAAVRDLWSRSELGNFTDTFDASLATHACRLLKVTPGTAPAKVATPTFNPAAGTYTSAQTVTISTTTSGATIHYTTDGSTPTETTGTPYSSPVSVPTSETLKAVAFKTGLTTSDVASAAYVISTGGGGVSQSFEAENVAFVGNGATASVQTDTKASAGKWVQLAGNSIGDFVDFTTPSIAAGTYQVQMEWKGNNNRGILTFKIDGNQLGGTLDQYSANPTYPTTTFGTITFASAGAHTIRLTVTGKNAASSNEDLSADKFIFTAQ